MKVLYVGSDSLACGASFSMVKLIEELDNMDINVVPVVHKGNTERLLSEKARFHYVVNTWSLALSNRYSPIKRVLIAFVKILLNIPCYFKYLSIINKVNPDIVHINALTVSTIARIAYKKKIPVVWHIRELLEEDLNSSFWYRKRAYSQMKRADMFIAISKCVEEKYTPIVGEGHITCIYNGVDKELFYRPDHKILQGDRIIITMAGRITPEKGQYLCLEKLLPILKKNSSIILRFAGVGTENEIKELEKLAEPVKDQVVFLGFVKTMPSLWEQTDIAIVYSKFEAFGRVTVEAKMAGVLVLGYKSGGTTELIEDGVDGFLFDEENSLDVVVEKALGNIKKAQEIAEKGREKASISFTSDNNARNVIDIYKSIIAT